MYCTFLLIRQRKGSMEQMFWTVKSYFQFSERERPFARNMDELASPDTSAKTKGSVWVRRSALEQI